MQETLKTRTSKINDPSREARIQEPLGDSLHVNEPVTRITKITRACLAAGRQRLFPTHSTKPTGTIRPTLRHSFLAGRTPKPN